MSQIECNLHVSIASQLVLGVFSLGRFLLLLAALDQFLGAIDNGVAGTLGTIAQGGILVLGDLSVGLSLGLVALLLGLVLSLLGGGTQIFSSGLGSFGDPVSGSLEVSLFVISGFFSLFLSSIHFLTAAWVTLACGAVVAAALTVTLAVLTAALVTLA